MTEIYSKYATSINPNIMNSSSERSKIDRIVIHHNATTNKDVAMNTWLQGGAANTSAHYEITPTEIIGCVGEEQTAWHSGDWNMNLRSIGLEHVNETGAPNWTVSDDTLDKSAHLIADICQRYGFEPNATTVIPHRSVTATDCPGGIDINKLIELARGYYFNGQSKPNPSPAPSNAINTLKNKYHGGFTIAKIKVDVIKNVNGGMQFGNYDLANGGKGKDKSFNWTNNGIPFALVNLPENANVKVGDVLTVNMSGTIDAYDNASNGVGVNFTQPFNAGMIWFNADALLNRF
ncbi:N-acetylmuramoyl-L-alanine amidase [Lactococcus petauri]|nr:N-acetylmuramoyl-L-alanine amidase [Lactococcus petauri]